MSAKLYRRDQQEEGKMRTEHGDFKFDEIHQHPRTEVRARFKLM